MKIDPKKLNSKIFKAYDIRGTYPEEIDENSVYLIGRAFAKFLNKKSPRIVIGQDNRLSSPALFEYLAKGITDQGGDVIDIGLSTTPMLYFASAHFDYDGGIEISASHNPGHYNGLKMVGEKGVPISGEFGLEEIKNIAESFSEKTINHCEKGRVLKKEILKDYIEFNLKDFDLQKIKPLKVVIDTSNAVPGILIPEVSKKINSEIYHLFPELDGSFPNHPPDPFEEENLKDVCREIEKRKADLGVAFDGDGDRIIFVDEKGSMISGDLITALLSKLILKESPGAKILYDLRSSNIIKEVVEKEGGSPVVWKIGHSLIKGKMREEGITFAGELSGHYYHKDHYFAEYPISVLLKVLEILSASEKTLSQIIKPFQKYFYSGEINFKVKEKEKILRKLEDEFKSGKVLKIDGLRVDFENWWFLVRPSNTEPLLRLVVEAKEEKIMEEKKKELTSLIKQGDQ